MPETCENWLGLLYICAYYARQTREMYQVLSYLVDFKAPVLKFTEWNNISQMWFCLE